MTKINRAWYTREDQVSSLNIRLTKEQLEKNHVMGGGYNHVMGDENMAKIMTQMDLLKKHVMGGGYKDMNVVGANSGVSPDDAQFEAMYNIEVQFLSNQIGGSLPSNPRPGGNHGWNRDRDESWRDQDRYWHDRGANWRDRDGDKDHYVHPHECPKLKEPKADPENFRIEDMLARILHKMERLDRYSRR
ncbi:hypothetical protein KY290_033778 [Solanum tuberosum]|uniref:Integrase core domain containing protein n=1 Tax=Solanum tuberosum TaxID=4113 RepID=A0ABQ7U4Y3_SOLTU|nr:hypothetical protein KY290_033778 [Solanum tuberosum]